MRPLLARILPLPLYSLSSVFVTGCYPLLSRIIGSFLSFLHSAPLRLRSIRFPIDVGESVSAFLKFPKSRISFF